MRSTLIIKCQKKSANSDFTENMSGRKILKFSHSVVDPKSAGSPFLSDKFSMYYFFDIFDSLWYFYRRRKWTGPTLLEPFGDKTRGLLVEANFNLIVVVEIISSGL